LKVAAIVLETFDGEDLQILRANTAQSFAKRHLQAQPDEPNNSTLVARENIEKRGRTMSPTNFYFLKMISQPPGVSLDDSIGYAIDDEDPLVAKIWVIDTGADTTNDVSSYNLP